MDIKIIPLVGIEAGGTRIELGMSSDEIISRLGEPETVYKGLPDTVQLYYYESEIRFDLDNENRLVFIEFLGGTDGKLMPEIYGVPAFRTKADELLDILTEKNN